MSGRKKGFPEKQWNTFLKKNPDLDPGDAIIKFKKLIKKRTIKAGKKLPKWMETKDDSYEDTSDAAVNHIWSEFKMKIHLHELYRAECGLAGCLKRLRLSGELLADSV